MRPRTRSAPTSALVDSAAIRVLGVAELVGLIINGFSQSELYRLLTLSRACLSEVQRIMYRNPSIVNLKKDDARLSVLTEALERHQGRARSFELSCRQYAFPDEEAIVKLLERLRSVTEFKFGGMFSRVIAGLRKALRPVAANLVKLTLQFRHGTASQTEQIALLLLACTALRHLTLVNLHLIPGLAGLSSAPTYRLATLKLDELQFELGSNDLGWLLGHSTVTLESLTVLGEPLKSTALVRLPQLAPNLKHATFNVVTQSRHIFVPIISLARQPSIQQVKITVDNEQCQVEWDDWLRLKDRVQGAVEQLDDESVAKITLNLIDYDTDDEDSDVEESDP